MNERTHERQMPHNIDAEQAVLGSILIDPDALVAVMDVLPVADDFYRSSHQDIYAAILDLAARRIPSDLLTVTDELARRGHLEEIGGASYVSSLANLVPTSANAAYYAEIVAQNATSRRLVHAAGEIAGIAYHEPNAEVALEEAERLLSSVRRLAGSATSRPYSVVLDELLEDTLARVEAVASGARYGLGTGFRKLDSLLVGLEPGELIYAAGRPGSGKSALVMAVAREVAIHLADTARKSGQPQEQVGTVEWVTLEMPGKQQARRMVASRAALDSKHIRAGFPAAEGSAERIDATAYHRFKTIVELQREQFGQSLRVMDGTVSLRGLRAQIARAVSERHCRLVVLDQLDLLALEAEGERRGVSEFERVTRFSRELKQIALQYGLTILCLVQLNRQVEYRQNKRPMLADLRQSGQLEQDADMVWGIYRPGYYDTERAEAEPMFSEFAELLVLKARDGVANVMVPLRYEGVYTRFTDWPLDQPIPQDNPRAGREGSGDDEEMAPARSGRAKQNGNGGRMPYGDD